MTDFDAGFTYSAMNYVNSRCNKYLNICLYMCVCVWRCIYIHDLQAAVSSREEEGTKSVPT